MSQSAHTPFAPVPFLGNRLPVLVERTPLSILRTEERHGSLYLSIPLSVSARELMPLAHERVGLWLKQQAHLVFHERVRSLNESFGFAVRSVTIKEMKSRWGSCSVGGRLNFNWRMILAPLPVLDYLVVHELAHLEEMNHSARFWGVVRRGCPDYRSHVLWLKTCGEDLMRWRLQRVEERDGSTSRFLDSLGDRPYNEPHLLCPGSS